MLVLKRKEGQWLNFNLNAEKYPELAELLMRIRVQGIRFNPRSGVGEVDLVIDDKDRHFDVNRPERAEARERIAKQQKALPNQEPRALTHQDA